MTPEQELAQLRTENAQLREQLAARDTLMAHLVERLQALETRLAQDSHNSSKPPQVMALSVHQKTVAYASPAAKSRVVKPGIRVKPLNKAKTRMR